MTKSPVLPTSTKIYSRGIYPTSPVKKAEMSTSFFGAEEDPLALDNHSWPNITLVHRLH